MALSEKDIDALAERILHGAQERYVTELTETVEHNLAELAKRGWTAAALEQLALLVPAAAAQILAQHRDAVGEEAASEVSAALEASAADDDAVLAAIYGAQAAAEAASRFPMGATSHFKEMALQTARGLADIIGRQNVILAESAARRWFEVAGEAVTSANLGLTPYDKLLAEATVKLADAGIVAVDYGHGGARTVTNMVDVAVRRHIVTQVSQASGRMTMARMRAYGHRLVVTSSHYGARPSHAEWQGLPCAIDGGAVVDGVRYPDIVELTGYGTVGGLKGANCRHSINPYFPGITELPAREWPEHEEKFGCSSEAYYEATQRQRELERRIRKTKREIAALERNGFGLEDATYVQKRLLLGNQQKTLARWCDERNLVRQYAREKAYGVATQPRALTGMLWRTRERGISRKKLAAAGTAVDLDYIRSTAYRKKFNGLTGNRAADEEIHRCAVAALTHRSGTYGEDLHLVSIMTGECAVSLTSSKQPLTVTPTKSLLEALKEHPEGTLFGVHNHPKSSPPSGSDFSASKARRYAGGVVALHNGEVYFYKHGHTEFSARGFDDAVQARIGKGLSEVKAYEAVLAEYAERFGVQWKKLR